MAELRLGDQLVRYDRDATVAAYAQLQNGDAERCGCSGCRNFISAREQAFPRQFKVLLAELGIDLTKDGEVVDFGVVDGGMHYYEGWFYFVGELIVIGERLIRIAAELNAGQLALASNGTASFEYWFSSSFARPPAVFGNAVTAVEFTTRIPWVLDEPYDPSFQQKKMMEKAEDVVTRYQNTLRGLAKPPQE